MNKSQGSHKRGDAILQGKDVHKIFKVGNNEVEVLKGVNIEIKKQEFIILFGSSGCGKSTLLNVMLGLEAPTEGKVVFMEEDIYSYEEDHRSQIRKEKVGLVCQQQNWFKSINVIENVALPLTLKGVLREERDQRAYELLEKVHMQDSAYQMPTELSSGQQQKVAFARALITDPVLLVADEPTGNLDSKSSIELMRMFSEYNEQGNTIVMVTHDLEFLTLATRSLNMSDGLIIAEYLRGDEELEKFKFKNGKK
jgi:putative ABC transport system ATP-binding protein